MDRALPPDRIPDCPPAADFSATWTDGALLQQLVGALCPEAVGRRGGDDGGPLGRVAGAMQVRTVVVSSQGSLLTVAKELSARCKLVLEFGNESNHAVFLIVRATQVKCFPHFLINVISMLHFQGFLMFLVLFE